MDCIEGAQLTRQISEATRIGVFMRALDILKLLV